MFATWTKIMLGILLVSKTDVKLWNVLDLTQVYDYSIKFVCILEIA